MSAKPIILGSLELDSGTEYEAALEVQHPSRNYEGRVLEFGYIDRSLPVPSGDYQGGDGRIRIADTDRKFRNLLAEQTPLRRTLSLKLVREGASESATQPFLVQEVKRFTLRAGDFEFESREGTFSYIDKQIPPLGNRENFPDLMEGVDDFVFPILFGERTFVSESSPEIPHGLFPLPRMTLSRWALSQIPILSCQLVRRLEGEESFTLVEAAEYDTTEEPITINGIDYVLSYVDFVVPQPPICEIQVVRFEGPYNRPAFGSLPELEYSPRRALRNPIDFWILVNHFLLAGEPRLPSYDDNAFVESWEDMESILGGSPVAGYKCDAILVAPMTGREFNGIWQRCFEGNVFVNRINQIAITFSRFEDPDRPVLSDGPVFGEPDDNSLILKNSVRQQAADPVVNRLRFNYEPTYDESGTPAWIAQQIADDDIGQAALGGTNGIPEIIEAMLDMPFVSDPFTAQHVVGRRMQFLALGSYRIELDAPLPEVVDLLELGQMAGVTHYGGLAIGGYRNTEFKITGLTHDLNRMLTTIRGVLRVPVEIAPYGVNPICSYTPYNYEEKAGQTFEGDFTVPGADWETIEYPFRQPPSEISNPRMADDGGGNLVLQGTVFGISEHIGIVSQHFSPTLKDQASTVIYKATGGLGPDGGPAVRIRLDSGKRLWETNREAWRGYVAFISKLGGGNHQIHLQGFCWDWGSNSMGEGSFFDLDGTRYHASGVTSDNFLVTDDNLPAGSGLVWEGSLQDGDEITLCAVCKNPTRLFVLINGVLVLFGFHREDPPGTDFDFTLNPETETGRPGIIIGNPPEDTSTLEFSGWRMAALKRLLYISTDPPLPNATRTVAYTTPVRCRVGRNVGEYDATPPINWAVVAGALPPGLELLPDEEIETISGQPLSEIVRIVGTPTTEGSFTFTLRARDETEPTPLVDVREYTIDVDPPPALEITTECPLADGALDVPYTGGFDASGGVPPYTWTMLSGSLPDGLTFNSDGSITGTPTEEGSFTVEAQVEDSEENTDSLECNLEITSGAGDFSGITEYRLLGTNTFDDGIDTIYDGQGVTIDIADHPDSTAFLIVVAKNAAAGNKPVDVVDESESVIATATITPTSGSNVLLAIASFSSFGSHTYSLKVRGDADPFDLEIKHAIMAVVPANAARTICRFPMAFGGSDVNEGGGYGSEQANNNGGFCRLLNGTAYATMDGCRFFLKTDANFDTIQNWFIDVAARAAGTGKGYAALFNETDNAMVAGAEVEFAINGNMGRQQATFSNSAGNFDNGDTFGFRFKADSGTNIMVAQADLCVRLNPALKGECHMLLIGADGFATTASGARQEMRYKHQPSVFTAGTSFLFEMTAKEVGGSSHAFVLDQGASDSGDSGSDVSGSQLDFSTSSVERQRTSALTLTDGNRYLFRPASSAGQTIRQAAGVIIAIVPEA